MNILFRGVFFASIVEKNLKFPSTLGPWIAILGFVLLLSIPGPDAMSQNDTLSKPALIDNIPNFHFVSPHIMRGGQPTDEGLRSLSQYYGVKTIISLKGVSEDNVLERSIVKGLNMNFINIPMDAGDDFSIETIEKMLEILTDPLKSPVYMHCSGGADRTGLLMAAYRIKYDGWSFDEAFNEMKAYRYDEGNFPKLKQVLLKWHEHIARGPVKPGI